MSVLIVVPVSGGADAMAVRAGDDVVVQISPSIPSHLHELIAEDLRQLMRLDSGRHAVATLPAGWATLPPIMAAPRSTHYTAARTVAARAAILIPLALTAMALNLLLSTPFEQNLPVPSSVATTEGECEAEGSS